MGFLFSYFNPKPIPVPDLILSNGSTVIRASARFGGAIYSINHNGFEYLDSSDHGRLLQTAFQLNGRGEAENPTEGGSSFDTVNSSTALRTSSVSGNVLTTVANLAYWHPYNGLVLSPHVMRKDVSLLGDVLRHHITISVVGDQQSISVEGLTAYMPRTFTRWHQRMPDGSLNALPPPDNPNTEWDIVACENPVIASVDDAHAIGCYSPTGGYAFGFIEGWPKWDAGLWSKSPCPAGSYSWDAVTCWGTLDEVRAALI